MILNAFVDYHSSPGQFFGGHGRSDWYCLPSIDWGAQGLPPYCSSTLFLRVLFPSTISCLLPSPQVSYAQDDHSAHTQSTEQMMKNISYWHRNHFISNFFTRQRISNCNQVDLLGQCCSLQFSSVLELPSHFPLYFSVTVFLRVFVFFPPPQLLEQEPSSQLPHTQLTSNK